MKMHVQKTLERVFLAAGIYPTSGNDFDALAAAMDRLCLTDASIGVKRENSDALGAGFRCGCGMEAGALQDCSEATHGAHFLNMRLPHFLNMRLPK